MNPHLFDEMHYQNQWLSLIQSQNSLALALSVLCQAEFAELILLESKRFTGQSQPKTPDELALRERQAAAVKSRISAMAHGDSMAKVASHATDEILQALRASCAVDLPKVEADFQRERQARVDLNSALYKLCSPDWSPQI
jgi:hypothetical protein